MDHVRPAISGEHFPKLQAEWQTGAIAPAMGALEMAITILVR